MSVREEWNSWSLLKKISFIGTVVGILSFMALLIEKGYSVLNKPNIIYDIAIENPSNNRLHLFKYGEAVYYYQGKPLNIERNKFILKSSSCAVSF